MIWDKQLFDRLISTLAPHFAYVGIDMGQYEPETRPKFKTPTVLIAPEGEEIIEMEKGATKYRLTVELRLFVDDARFASASAPSQHQAAYISLLDKITKLSSLAQYAFFSFGGWRMGLRQESLQEVIITYYSDAWQRF